MLILSKVTSVSWNLNRVTQGYRVVTRVGWSILQWNHTAEEEEEYRSDSIITQFLDSLVHHGQNTASDS